MHKSNLFDAAYTCLMACDPGEKVRLTQETARAWREGRLGTEGGGPPEPVPAPGLPNNLKLVMPRDLPRRKPNTSEGRAVLIHSLTHIEFNAINLAWDAVYRFRDMPRDFYTDWVRVADEEAHHFTLLRNHLQRLDYAYGDFPGHNGLWEMANKTAHDVLVRMTLVPRCLEARGLDVNPGIRTKLVDNGDAEAGPILDIIMHDEIGHVAIGNRWFRHLCAQRELDAETTYRQLVDEYLSGPLRPPFHIEARREAGFSEAELSYLEGVG